MLRDSLETISNTLDVRENRIFLQNVIPTKSQYEGKSWELIYNLL